MLATVQVCLDMPHPACSGELTRWSCMAKPRRAGQGVQATLRHIACWHHMVSLENSKEHAARDMKCTY